MLEFNLPGAISIQGLTKRFGTLAAVSHLDLEVQEGEVLGFLGLNGAGKTTTIRILLDLLRPTSGTARILGQDCQKDSLATRSLIGYLPSEMGLYGNMTGREVLDLLGKLSRTSSPLRNQLLDRLELSQADLRRNVREYSTGMKRKLGIVQAMQHDPPVLILDEPTEGLDPLVKESFYELLGDAHRRTRTIFFSSHVLSEVDRICDRIALLRKGELVLLATTDECRGLAARSVRVSLKHPAPPPSFPAGIQLRHATPLEWDLSIEGPLRPLLDLLSTYDVADLAVSEAKLEDVLRRYYAGDSQ